MTEKPKKILITNDDGISSPCLLPLAQWAKRRFGDDVTVIAPKVEQSGKSHGIDIKGAFEVKETDLLPGIRAWTVDSTPADCVRVALLGMGMQPDLVISGINRGYNMGFDILYSGTDGAAFEANLFGFRAVALSTDFASFAPALEQLDRVFDFFDEKGLWDIHTLYNVNCPPDPKGILVTRQGGPYYSDTFEVLEGDMWIARGVMAHQNKKDLTIDTDAVVAGYISVSPLTVDRTDLRVYEKLEGRRE